MDRVQEIERIRRMAQDAYDNDRTAGEGYDNPWEYADALYSTIEHDLDEQDAGLLRAYLVEWAFRRLR